MGIIQNGLNLFMSHETLSSLSDLHQKDAVTSCSVVSHHLSGPLHEVGDILHDVQPSIGWGAQIHHCRCGLFYEMGRGNAYFQS